MAQTGTKVLLHRNSLMSRCDLNVMLNNILYSYRYNEGEEGERL